MLYDDLLLSNIAESDTEFENETNTMEVLERSMKYVHSLYANQAVIWIEQKRLSEISASYGKKIERMLKYIDFLMNANEIEAAKFPTWSLGYRKSNYIDVIDTTLIPQEYIVTKETQSVDKEKITTALKDWIEIPWVVLWTRKNLQIK